MSEQLLVERHEAVATVTLNRPAKRNALSAVLMNEISATVISLDLDPTVRAIVLTGADPAFCAGFDLRNLSTELSGVRSIRTEVGAHVKGLMPRHDTPIVGAINGAAVTGGMELALGCDFLIASERAAFADTHARVGVLPGGGMTIRLPQLIGVDRARRMSLTGDFIDAATALAWGLVVELTAHEDLLARAQQIAASIASIDPVPVAALRALYDEIGDLEGPAAWERERRANREWMRDHFSSVQLAEKVDAVIDRGSSQI